MKKFMVRFAALVVAFDAESAIPKMSADRGVFE